MHKKDGRLFFELHETLDLTAFARKTWSQRSYITFKTTVSGATMRGATENVRKLPGIQLMDPLIWLTEGYKLGHK